MDLTGAPRSVRRQVERFLRDKTFLVSDRYGEADTRKEFIDPMFEALGWDMANAHGYADAYKDVVHEYSLKIGDTHKAPDYSFRVGGNRRFFLEAKRPGVDITKDPGPAYQLRRYAWTAKLPVSALSNFRHIAIYDCTKRPSESDKPAVARTLLVPVEGLRDRWSELVELLGKDSVYKGSLDRYAAAGSRRRGTSEVDNAFLEQMEAWRTSLARNFALRNTSLTVEELNDAVQQTIDRLIFLRIAEDRGIEPYGQLKRTVENAKVYEALVDVFQSADTRYNSGLFHFKKERGITASPDLLTPTLVADNKIMREMVHGMYYPSPYEFSVMPADILGQVYEQFLGKVIRLTSNHRAKIEDKPEVKRAGGVYYTPTHVVEYIVKRTLDGALKEKTARQALNVRIVDPACGSGSFLIAAYDHLVRWFTEKYAEDPKTQTKYLFRDKSNAWRITLAERKRIVTSCLFGVDIDRQAVEVTKLSLMLKILEGESEETINAQLPMFHMSRVLPDLDRNVQCGNSLVTSEVYEHMTLTHEDETAINPFDWKDAFPNVFKSGGFDALIGNPPYDVLEKNRGEASWPHAVLHEYLQWRDDLSPVLGGKLNLYRLFLAQSLTLVKDKGWFGMIVPLSLMADISTASTRRHLFTHLDELLVDCFPQKDNAKTRIFKKAKLSTAIVTGMHRSKDLGTRNAISTRVFPRNVFSDESLENTLSLVECALLDPVNLPVPLTDAAQWQLCKRLHSGAGVGTLGSEISYKVTRGEINQTTCAEYITSNPRHARMLKGVEVGAFHLRTSVSQGQQEWFDEQCYLGDYPSRRRPTAPRIATQRITGVDERTRLVASVVPNAMYFADSTNSIAPVPGAELSLDYLCGLLNSDVWQWRFRLTSTNNNVGTNELKALPLPPMDLVQATDRAVYEDLTRLARRISELQLELATTRSAAKTTAVRRRLAQGMDRLNRTVALLYGMTDGDQRLIADRLHGLPTGVGVAK
jgi:Alw26I/Eco31I/Esp3I family type II restriction m6 adenine DNA methyltransferase